VLRQAIEKQMDRIEHVHRFTRAVSVGNPLEFLQAEKEDQELEEACKRLIKNCITCWNYLYLSQKLEEIKDTASREALLDAVAHSSAVALSKRGTKTRMVVRLHGMSRRPRRQQPFALESLHISQIPATSITKAICEYSPMIIKTASC
jgi:hypothetical protein